MSKGSKQRPCDREKFADGWERVFGVKWEGADDSPEQLEREEALRTADERAEFARRLKNLYPKLFT